MVLSYFQYQAYSVLHTVFYVRPHHITTQKTKQLYEVSQSTDFKNWLWLTLNAFWCLYSFFEKINIEKDEEGRVDCSALLNKYSTSDHSQPPIPPAVDTPSLPHSPHPHVGAISRFFHNIFWNCYVEANVRLFRNIFWNCHVDAILVDFFITFSEFIHCQT